MAVELGCGNDGKDRIGASATTFLKSILPTIFDSDDKFVRPYVGLEVSAGSVSMVTKYVKVAGYVDQKRLQTQQKSQKNKHLYSYRCADKSCCWKMVVARSKPKAIWTITQVMDIHTGACESCLFLGKFEVFLLKCSTPCHISGIPKQNNVFSVEGKYRLGNANDVNLQAISDSLNNDITADQRKSVACESKEIETFDTTGKQV
jgi:hypothetical protein